MSLTAITEAQLEQARAGQLSRSSFIEIIRRSLPFAYEAVGLLAARLAVGERVAIEAPLHMDDDHRSQLLRVFASDSMRRALQRHFGLRLAFQNCHYIAATKGRGRFSRQWRTFCSERAQVLAQRPELRDC